MRFSRLLRHGAVSGAVAGLVAALVMWLHSEPVIRRALAVEQAREHAAGSHDHEELVSRTAQVVVGACTAAIVGVLFGLVFAVVFARVRHRLPGASDHARALWLAVLGFGVFTLLPALVVPADPPAVGDPDTVTRRTLGYVLTILVGLLLVGLVSGLDGWLAGRGSTDAVRRSADLLAAAVLVPVAWWLLPDVSSPIPSDVPASLIWDFRVASLLQLAAMWGVLGTVFGLLVAREESPARDPEPVLSR
jgi:predicted cobalt transporter CbtA